MRRFKPELEGQQLVPGTGFLPGERWCTDCGGPLTYAWERDNMICETCNPIASIRTIRGTKMTKAEKRERNRRRSTFMRDLSERAKGRK